MPDDSTLGSEFSLDDLHWRGSWAVVVRLELAPAEAQRLKSLGVFVGQRIERSQLGNPMIFAAAGSRIAVAPEVAKRIIVRPAREYAA